VQGSGLPIHQGREVKIATFVLSNIEFDDSTTPRTADTLLSIPTTRLRNILVQLYPRKTGAMPSETSVVSSGFRWLQRKRYQYEVTFSLYMLTPTEKFIFSTSTLSSRCIGSICPRCAPNPGVPFNSNRAPFQPPTPPSTLSHDLVQIPVLTVF
jgi:hypothetical protein